MLRDYYNYVELQNDYNNEIETEREMLSSYQLKIGDFYNILIGTLRNWYLAFLIKKSMWFIIFVNLRNSLSNS